MGSTFFRSKLLLTRTHYDIDVIILRTVSAWMDLFGPLGSPSSATVGLVMKAGSAPVFEWSLVVNHRTYKRAVLLLEQPFSPQ